MEEEGRRGGGGREPEIPSIVAIFNVVADCIKHLFRCINIPCIQNLVEGGR